jgi:hypothetical protein
MRPFCAIAVALAMGSTVACRIERVRPIDTPTAVVLAAVAQTLGARACGLSEATIVTEVGVGALQIGELADSVRVRCRVIEERVTEGQGSMRVDLIRDTAVVAVAEGRVSQVDLHHSPFQTADSLGVGRHLTRLMRLPEVAGITVGGRLYAVSPAHCGLRFLIVDPAPAPPAAQTGRGALNRLPGETTIERVEIVGCSSR